METLITIVKVAVLVITFPIWILPYCLWVAGTTDWFGLRYEDKSSAYYHDKTGRGRGR